MPQPITDLDRPKESMPVPIFSFANSELGPISRVLIRNMEKMTGQPRIKKLYLDYINSSRPKHLFWQDALERLCISTNLNFEPGAYIPKTGPLLVIANHPFGVIDGVILCSEISKIRPDYKIITHELLRQEPSVMHQILPIDFRETQTALHNNLETRQQALDQIKQGGVLIMFPSGGISLAPKIIGSAYDPEWKPFVAKLAMMRNTTTLPVFFTGQNSVVYMAARKISLTLGYSLMFRETARSMGSTIDLAIRKPIASADLQRFENRNQVVSHLRKMTHGLNN